MNERRMMIEADLDKCSREENQKNESDMRKREHVMKNNEGDNVSDVGMQRTITSRYQKPTTYNIQYQRCSNRKRALC